MTITIAHPPQILSNITHPPQILSNDPCCIPPPSNLVKSAHAQILPTVRLRKLPTRLTRSMRNWVDPRHVIAMMWQRRLFSRRPPSTAAFSVQRMGSQRLWWRLSLSNWHGRMQIRNLECLPWHWHQILRKSSVTSYNPSSIFTSISPIYQIKACGSQAHGEAKEKTKSLVETMYGFESSHSKKVIAANRKLAEELKQEKGFIY